MKTRFYVLVGMVLAAAAFRLLPHPLNFAPIAGMALFGGAHFSEKRQAFLIPLAAMLLSDLVIGFHSTVPFVYLSFILIVGIGMMIRKRRQILPIAGAATASSLLFFAVTNFGVWAVQDLYPKTAVGLGACYIAALPFLQNTLLGDALTTAVLFGGFVLAERRLPILRETLLARGS